MELVPLLRLHNALACLGGDLTIRWTIWWIYKAYRQANSLRAGGSGVLINIMTFWILNLVNINLLVTMLAILNILSVFLWFIVSCLLIFPPILGISLRLQNVQLVR